MRQSSPFFSPEDPFSLVGREPELRAIHSALQSPAGRIAVLAFPRMGLSTLLSFVSKQARILNAAPIAHVKLDVSLDTQDAAQRLFSAIGTGLGPDRRELLLAVAQRVNAAYSVQRDVSGTERFTFTDRPSDADRDIDAFRVLDALNQSLESGREQMTVIIDDFEELFARSEKADWSLKLASEQHGRISYLLGSTAHEVLAQRFFDRRSGLWRAFMVLELIPLTSSVLEAWLRKQFERLYRRISDQATTYLVKAAGPRTADVARLARAVLNEAAPTEEITPRIVSAAVVEIVEQFDSHYVSTWSKYDVLERRILCAVATTSSQNLLASEAVSRYRLEPRSSAYRKYRELLADGTIVTQGENSVDLDDPFLREWIRRRVIGPLGSHMQSLAHSGG
jgi:hypothetical protein